MNINIYTNININKHINQILNEKWVLFNSVKFLTIKIRNMRFESSLHQQNQLVF